MTTVEPGRETKADASAVDGDYADSRGGHSPLTEMYARLSTAIGVDFAVYENRYRTFMSGVELAVQESEFYGALFDLHSQLSSEHVVGSIRAIEAWADGETEFRIVQKSWESVIDKLVRINIDENRLFAQGSPPLIQSIFETAMQETRPARQCWITPDMAHDFVDDLIRTKFVVPFADGVVEVSDRITRAIDKCGLPRFRRYHAKDSGYHAQHHYIVLSVPGYRDESTNVALEVKVLTKMQDTLGELTHLLYESKRTGRIPSEEKRKLAWLFDDPDFISSYIGHAGHYIEASMVGLKNNIHGLEEKKRG